MCLKPQKRYSPDNKKFMVYSTTAAVVNPRLSSIFQLLKKIYNLILNATCI